jgi:hypothetical protein
MKPVSGTTAIKKQLNKIFENILFKKLNIIITPSLGKANSVTFLSKLYKYCLC